MATKMDDFEQALRNLVQPPQDGLFFPTREVVKLRLYIQHNYERLCLLLRKESPKQIQTEIRVLPTSRAGDLNLLELLSGSSAETTTKESAASGIESEEHVFQINSAGELLLPILNSRTLETTARDFVELFCAMSSRDDKTEDDDLRRLKHTLLVEYCMLHDWLVQGVLVLPSVEPTLLEWEGIVSPEGGVYGGLHIRFKINFPKKYPAEPPQVVFEPVLPHPLIEPESGLLSLKPGFGKWHAEAHNMVQILAYIRSLFFDHRYLRPVEAVNEQAQQQIRSLGLVGAGISFREKYPGSARNKTIVTNSSRLTEAEKLAEPLMAEVARKLQGAAEGVGKRRMDRTGFTDSHIDLLNSADLLKASDDLWDTFCLELERGELLL